MAIHCSDKDSAFGKEEWRHAERRAKLENSLHLFMIFSWFCLVSRAGKKILSHLGLSQEALLARLSWNRSAFTK